MRRTGRETDGRRAGEKCVTNVRITSENNTAGVSGRGGRFILMRITNPRHTRCQPSPLAVCVCVSVYLSGSA